MYINDKPKDEKYILEQNMRDFNEVTVPQNTVFVLGDNRNNSRDNSPDIRCIGFVDINGSKQSNT